MSYQCPKGHQSTDSDYCSECGALIGQSKIASSEPIQGFNTNKSAGSPSSGGDICPDCGTPRTFGARFCEVCRHDFQENKTGAAEAILASQQAPKSQDSDQQSSGQISNSGQPAASEAAKAAPTAEPSQPSQVSKPVAKDTFVVTQKLNVVIAVDKAKADSCDIETPIKPDSQERVFPLDLDENLVGRRSVGKGIYPEIEINDPGVSKRHLKFIKQSDGSFAVLELGSANGTELNGLPVEPGINTPVKAGDELLIGIWTILKLVSR